MRKILYFILPIVLSISVIFGGFMCLKKFAPKIYNGIVNVFQETKDYIDMTLNNTDGESNIDKNLNELVLTYVSEKDSSIGLGNNVDIYVKCINYNFSNIDFSTQDVNVSYKGENYTIFEKISNDIYLIVDRYDSKLYEDLVALSTIKVALVR